uniref:Uncharacterized protein n=1 Tax=Anguilla anguilla TaxID=7936 RepID=A0A0E9PFT5_ANGAN
MRQSLFQMLALRGECTCSSPRDAALSWISRTTLRVRWRSSFS